MYLRVDSLSALIILFMMMTVDRRESEAFREYKDTGSKRLLASQSTPQALGKYGSQPPSSSMPLPLSLPPFLPLNSLPPFLSLRSSLSSSVLPLLPSLLHTGGVPLSPTELDEQRRQQEIRAQQEARVAKVRKMVHPLIQGVIIEICMSHTRHTM